MKLTRAVAPMCAFIFFTLIIISALATATSFSAFIIHGGTGFQLTIPQGFTMGSIVTPQHMAL